MLCWLADDHNPQLEEIVSNFEITNERIFSVAGRMSKCGRCPLPNKRFETFINSLVSVRKRGFLKKHRNAHGFVRGPGITPLLFGLRTWSKCQKMQQVF